MVFQIHRPSLYNMFKSNFMKIISCLVLLLFFSCKKQNDQYSVQNIDGPQVGDIISFQSVSSILVDADGVSLSTIKVKVHPEASTASRNVVFKISGKARFSNGDTLQIVTVNTEGYATVSCRDTVAEPVQFKAMVDSFSIDTIIQFLPALPDDMQLSADDYVLDSTSGQSIVLTATLFRDANRGVVSEGLKVYYRIVPLDTTINFVYPLFQFAQQRVAVITAENPFKAGGRFTAEAKVVSASGDTIVKTIPFRVE